MVTAGKFCGLARDLHGDLVISFTVPESAAEKVSNMDGTLSIEITKKGEKRSLDANRYLWKLCTMIADALGSDKDTVYKLQLSRYGFYVDTVIPEEQAESLRSKFRFTEEYEDPFDQNGTRMLCIRCYIGSSHYDSYEMGRLLRGTIEDAKDLGLQAEVWDENEIEMMIREWRSR